MKIVAEEVTRVAARRAVPAFETDDSVAIEISSNPASGSIYCGISNVNLSESWLRTSLFSLLLKIFLSINLIVTSSGLLGLIDKE